MLTEGLKEIRHEVRRAAERLAGDALDHRDSDGDVGRGSATASELARGSLASVTRANFARAEEALRVLERVRQALADRVAGRVRHREETEEPGPRRIAEAEWPYW